jgi:2-polyprenyl-6-methoxyphenol hydroxylase-like FAD-dependent oxidoreductase
MQNTDVVIIGGGLAGSLMAAMLGEAGIDAILVDPHEVYPPDFRCEKFDGVQVAILRKTGLADDILRATTPDRESWVARFGRVVERRPGDQQGFLYQTVVNTAREIASQHTKIAIAKATAAVTGGDRQHVTLSNGDEISARLIVLANGLNIGLRHTLGLTREMLSECHSITIGFDARPSGNRHFPFPALTYYADHTANQAAYLTLFPIGSTMRANLCTYRHMDDPWLREFRTAPRETLLALMPGLRPLMGDFEVDGPVKVRPADLYATRGHRQAGIVLAGDAFSTSCPAAGTGTLKVLTDVERLCNVYIPRWLATGGMNAAKIGEFYDDPDKVACDEFSLSKAYSLKSFSLDDAPAWRARRYAKFLAQYGVGTLRQMRRALASPQKSRQGAAAATHSG